MEDDSLRAVTDAVLLASTVLVAVAARSLADARDVTLPQFRALVILSSRGPQNLTSLADALEVSPSTATRLADRLVQKDLVRRKTSKHDRREVRLVLTPAGRALVVAVTARRRAEIADILRKVPEEQRAHLVDALVAFGRAAGEVPEQAWSLGWSV